MLKYTALYLMKNGLSLICQVEIIFTAITEYYFIMLQ